MTPDQVKNSYMRAMNNHVTVRRYLGTGTGRTTFDVPNVRARVVGYQPNELVGTIVQGDKRAIIYADDVIAGGISDLSVQDKIIENGREYNILALDASTRKLYDVLVAYELQLRG